MRSATVFGVAAGLALAGASGARAEVVSGTALNWAGADASPEAFVDNALVMGDGVNHVVATWTLATFNWFEPGAPLPAYSGYFYATNHSLVGAPFDSMDVAWAQGVTDVSQIVDASSYDFVLASEANHLIGHTHLFADAKSNDGSPGSTHAQGVGDYLILRNARRGFYGVLRVDDIHSFNADGRPFAHMDATWWFQTDGTGDFSSVPAPCAALLLAGAAVLRRRGRSPG